MNTIHSLNLTNLNLMNAVAVAAAATPYVWDEYRQALAIWQEQKPHSNTYQETN
ncbi:hypothetical protein ACOBV8_20610 (plasmid) [Pseudoalteromonas espejiana]